jgi:hypothetical protein
VPPELIIVHLCMVHCMPGCRLAYGCFWKLCTNICKLVRRGHTCETPNLIDSRNPIAALPIPSLPLAQIAFICTTHSPRVPPILCHQTDPLLLLPLSSDQQTCSPCCSYHFNPRGGEPSICAELAQQRQSQLHLYCRAVSPAPRPGDMTGLRARSKAPHASLGTDRVS